MKDLPIFMLLQPQTLDVCVNDSVISQT